MLNANAARMTKGVVGKTGRIIPIIPNRSDNSPNSNQRCLDSFIVEMSLDSGTFELWWRYSPSLRYADKYVQLQPFWLLNLSLAGEPSLLGSLHRHRKQV